MEPPRLEPPDADVAGEERTAAHFFRAAMFEFHRNIEMRRLMFVVINVLLPATVMAASDCLSGADYPPALAWLPRHIIEIVGFLLAASGILISITLARCHFGLVLNATKLRVAISGASPPESLNWFGVTTSFVILTWLTAGAGLALLLFSVAPWWLAAGGSLAFLGLAPIGLLVNHRKALERVEALKSAWKHGPIPVDLREQHARTTLEDASADIAVIVTMAAALFAGFFNAMTNVGAVPDGLELSVPVAWIKLWGVPTCAGYMTVSLLLSARMVLRLRTALARFAATLADIRGEKDDPWRFSFGERTHLLFLVVQLFAGCAAAMFLWTFTGAAAAIGLGAALVVLGSLRYGIALRRTASGTARGGRRWQP